MGPITMCSTQNGIEGYDMNDKKWIEEKCTRVISDVYDYDRVQSGYNAALYHLINGLAPLFMEVLLDIRDQLKGVSDE